MSPELDKEPASHAEMNSAARARSRRFQLSPLQIVAWSLLLALGAIQTWNVRHLIYSDGVSYLDLAGHYLRGDWRNAFSDYWSPLFPWVLAFVFKLFRPSAYWQAATLHCVNFGFFMVSIGALELFIGELLRKQHRLRLSGQMLSVTSIRLVAYSAILWAGLHLIGIGDVTPDMIAMALTIFTSYLLLKVDGGTAGDPTYLALGATLGLGFLDRAALLPLLPVCLVIVGILLKQARVPILRPLSCVGISSTLLIAPFIAAMSAANAHLTLGMTGKLNYAWEVDGAARHIHWQGEPGDIGVPTHPTHKVIDHPATYTFAAGNIPGAYPPWYRPSYWYDGVNPRLKLRAQARVLLAHTAFFIYLLLFSPILIPCLLVAKMAGWRKWLSSRGIGTYWFLLVPMAASVFLYCLVFLERRYIAGPLVVSWMCMIASLAVPQSLRSRANLVMMAFALLFSAGLWANWMSKATAEVFRDLVGHHETEWNLQWMLADRFQQLGVRAGDRIAYIGQAIDSDWVRIAGAKVVAEVPVIWDRFASLNRFIKPDNREPQAFWKADEQTRARVLQAFRKAGASLVVADNAPEWAAREGWKHVFPPGTPHLPTETSTQPDVGVTTAYLFLTNFR